LVKLAKLEVNKVWNGLLQTDRKNGSTFYTHTPLI